MNVGERMRRAAEDFAEDLSAILSEEDAATVAERVAQLGDLYARAHLGEEGLGPAIASRRRSLSMFQTAAGVAVGEAFTTRARAIVHDLYTAALALLL